MNEVEKVEAATPTQIQPTVSLQPETKTDANSSAKIKSITTSVVGNRLQISADVSADEIDALKDMLSKYQEILKLLN